MKGTDELTPADFEGLDIADLLERSKRRHCGDYSDQFFDLATQLAESGQERRASAALLLGHVTGMMPRSGEESKSAPFGPLAVLDGSRTAIPEDLSDHDLDLLKTLVESIDDPELRARLADLVWLRSRQFPMVTVAIPSYLHSAQTLVDDGDWAPAVKRIERALRLSASVGRNNQGLFSSVTTYIESILAAYDVEADPGLVAATLLDLLLEHGHGEPARYAAFAEELARKRESRSDWRSARRYWEIASRWHEADGNETSQRACLVTAAETHLAEADEALSSGTNPHTLAASHLQSAVQSMRRIGEVERAKALHLRLLEEQKASTSELQSVSVEVDFAEFSDQARAAVRDKTLLEALARLSLLSTPRSVGWLEKVADEHIAATPVLSLISHAPINSAGRVVGRRGSALSEEAEEAAAARRAEMLGISTQMQQGFALASVEAARRQIVADHHVRVEEFVELVSGSPFVPINRESVIARGLYAGLHGDWLVASHVLIPQIEHSIRELMMRIGAITSGLEDPSGIQEEHNLNQLLYRPELRSIFSEDVIFDLQGLLVEKFGTNLRNRVAHGLMDQAEFGSPADIYLWWLSLRLCLFPQLWNGSRNNTSSEVRADVPAGIKAVEVDTERAADAESHIA